MWRAYPWSFFIGSLLTGVLSVTLAYFAYTLLAQKQVGIEFQAYAGTDDYMSFIIVGAAVYLFAVRLMLGVSRSLITERREGTLEALLLAPARRVGYFVGVTLQWVLACAGEVALMLLLAWPLGLSLSRVQPTTLLLALPTAFLGLFGMAVMLSTLMLYSGDTYISQNTLFIAMGLLCGFSFPTAYLPQPAQWLGELLPATSSLRLLRAALLEGANLADLIVDVGRCTALGVVYTLAGFTLLRFAEWRALENKQ
jgi:ABC-2 type transport system permease protein